MRKHIFLLIILIIFLSGCALTNQNSNKTKEKSTINDLSSSAQPTTQKNNNDTSKTKTLENKQDLDNKQLIEKYYSILGTDEAYAMKFNPTMDLKTYKARYKNETYAYTYDKNSR